LIQAGSGAATFGHPNSPGVPAGTVAQTFTVPYNDPDALDQLFRQRGSDIACFIVEPIPGNMGLVLPRDDYLARAAEIARLEGALVVFDEVISGFRVAYGGAQQRFGVVPDITTLGKIVGGGMPVGAFGARREIMEQLSPTGPVYQSGTLSGNPITMAAGVAALTEIGRHGFYADLEEKGSYFFGRLREHAERYAAEDAAGLCVNSIGGVGTLFFTTGPVTDYASAKRSDTARYGRFFQGMLQRGIYLPPSQFECLFVSAAHSREDLDATLRAADETLREME
jgi:glutamate-1-semialdehyde 2,1-aminomutase